MLLRFHIINNDIKRFSYELQIKRSNNTGGLFGFEVLHYSAETFPAFLSTVISFWAHRKENYDQNVNVTSFTVEAFWIKLQMCVRRLDQIISTATEGLNVSQGLWFSFKTRSPRVYTSKNDFYSTKCPKQHVYPWPLSSFVTQVCYEKWAWTEFLLKVYSYY